MNNFNKYLIEVKPNNDMELLRKQTEIPLMQNELFIVLLFIFGISVIAGGLLGRK